MRDAVWQCFRTGSVEPARAAMSSAGDADALSWAIALFAREPVDTPRIQGPLGLALALRRSIAGARFAEAFEHARAWRRVDRSAIDPRVELEGDSLAVLVDALGGPRARAYCVCSSSPSAGSAEVSGSGSPSKDSTARASSEASSLRIGSGVRSIVSGVHASTGGGAARTDRARAYHRSHPCTRRELQRGSNAPCSRRYRRASYSACTHRGCAAFSVRRARCRSSGARC